MKSLQAQFSSCQLLMLCTAPASAKKMWCVISCFDQNMAFGVNTSEKQAKHEQEELKHSFHVPGFSASADCHNYGHDVLGDWSQENNRKVNLCCLVHILPYLLLAHTHNPLRFGG